MAISRAMEMPVRSRGTPVEGVRLSGHGLVPRCLLAVRPRRIWRYQPRPQFGSQPSLVICSCFSLTIGRGSGPAIEHGPRGSVACTTRSHVASLVASARRLPPLSASASSSARWMRGKADSEIRRQGPQRMAAMPPHGLQLVPPERMTRRVAWRPVLPVIVVEAPDSGAADDEGP